MEQPIKTSEEKSIFEVLVETFDDVPEEERENLPADGAENHDHYLYVAPKQSERLKMQEEISMKEATTETTALPEQKSIFEILLEGMKQDIPEEEWEKLPTDGAENHDHYLYGAPKKSEEPLERAA